LLELGFLLSHLIHIHDLLAVHELVDDPLETLSALNHVSYQLSLIVSLELLDVIFKFNISATNFDHEVIIVNVLLDILSLRSNHVEVALDMLDWDLDIILKNVE